MKFQKKLCDDHFTVEFQTNIFVADISAFSKKFGIEKFSWVLGKLPRAVSWVIETTKTLRKI